MPGIAAYAGANHTGANHTGACQAIVVSVVARQDDKGLITEAQILAVGAFRDRSDAPMVNTAALVRSRRNIGRASDMGLIS